MGTDHFFTTFLHNQVGYEVTSQKGVQILHKKMFMTMLTLTSLKNNLEVSVLLLP